MTTATTAKVSMSDAQFKKLRTIIYDRSGIHFPDNKKYILESRLGLRLAELEIEDFDHYISFISVGPYRDDEFQEMFNRITINETSFFRNEPQLDHFEKSVLAQLLEARKATKRIRVWSAACSSGEEPYTLAIMLHRTLGVRLADWRVEILGTDISQKMLDVAVEGLFSDYAMRSTPEFVRRRYFKQEGKHWRIDPTVRSMVSFEHMNLRDRLAARRHGTWDVIFCRNVMIYFDTPMKKQVVQMFHEQLAKDGTLFIGHSESLRDLDVAFQAIDVPQAFAYRKA